MNLKTLLTALLLPISCSFGQLTIYSDTPQSLVSSYLKMPGDSIFNVTMNGFNQGFTGFTDATSSIGFDAGIFMSTGINSSFVGPNNSENTGYDTGFGGDPIYDSLIPFGNSFNAMRLSFDIIPANSVILYEFIFASEEYLEYVGSQFVDGVAVNAIGPGLPGTINYAKAPNGMNVSPNSVHPYVSNTYGSQAGLNDYFYNDNPLGSNFGHGFDGFTKPLRIEIPVTIDSTYHIDIIIADAFDGVWDSGLFVRNCSAPCTASIEENDKTVFSVYPNPSSGIIHIDTEESTGNLIGSIYVMTSTGQVVQSWSNLHKNSFDIDLTPGMYFIMVESNEKQHFEKVIVE